jgi:hypothetical protein
MTVIEYVSVGLAALTMVARVAMFLPRPAKVQSKRAA